MSMSVLYLYNKPKTRENYIAVQIPAIKLSKFCVQSIMAVFDIFKARSFWLTVVRLGKSTSSIVI